MSGKSATLKKAQGEVRRLEKLKQEILSRMPKKKNFLTKQLVKLLERQLDQLEEKLQKALSSVEESTNASDLIDLDALSKIVDDVMAGDIDDILDDVKDIAADQVGDLIDDKIKDSDIGDKLKDVVDDVVDGDIDGVVDTVKDGIKDEVGDLIDDKIEDSDLGGKIKDVLGDVLEGDLEGALDTVKDGVKDIIEDKIDDLVDDLIGKFEKQIVNKLTKVIDNQVGGLISKALDAVRKKVGTDTLAGELLTNITKRLEKEAGAIVKSEIDKLLKGGGLKDIIKSAKDAAFTELKGGLKGRKIDDILKDILAEVIKGAEFKGIISGIKRRILAKFIEIVEEELEKTLGPIIDEYLKRYGSWNGQLLDTGKRTTKIGPFWGCVSIALSVQANLSATLSSKRKGLGATAKGKLSGKAYAGVGIALGFDIPIVGDISIEGGIQGGPELVATASLSLGVEKAILKASVNPVTLNIDMSAQIYLETPIPNYILAYIPDFVPSIKVVGTTLYYPLGRVNVLVASTPCYSLTFDIAKGEYNYTGAVGKYSIDLNPEVKAYIKETKDAISGAAQTALDYVNPMTYDLNPFDSEGWIGKWF
jgi:hypothetical protein